MVHIMGEGKKKTKRIGHIFKLNKLKVKLKIYHYKSCWVKKKKQQEEVISMWCVWVKLTFDCSAAEKGIYKSSVFDTKPRQKGATAWTCVTLAGEMWKSSCLLQMDPTVSAEGVSPKKTSLLKDASLGKQKLFLLPYMRQEAGIH